MVRACGTIGARAGALALLLCAPGCGGGEERSLLNAAPLRGEVLASGAERVLDDGASLAHAVQLSAGGELRMAGVTDGAGRLTLELALSDLRTGQELPRSAPYVLHLDGGPFDHDVPLPGSEDGLLVIDLTWEGDAALRLDRLDVHDEEPVDRPNILFISIDTLAADHMSTYGYARETTPNVDRLVEDSVLFERCFSNAPWTTPSYASQFTGLYAPTFYFDPDDRPDLLTYHVPPERWTLAERLAAAGYRTAAYIDNPVAGPEFGLEQGFELYDMSAAGISITEMDGGLRYILPRAEEWLAGLEEDEPFFLLVQAVDCHIPYLPPEGFAGRFVGDGLWDAAHSAPVSISPVRYDALPRRAVYPHAEDGVVPEEMATAPFVDAYDAEIADTDDALGAFLDALEAAGRLEDTIVVFTADHGESMLQHRWFFGHGINYDEILHVPLIVRLPGGEHAGRRVAQDVQLVDLLPTLSELAGLPLEPTGLHGRSLVPLIEGGTLESTTIFAGHGLHQSVSVQRDGWKLIESIPADVSVEILVSHPLAHAWITEKLEYDPGPGLLSEDLVQLFGKKGHDPRDFLPLLMADLSDPVYELYDLAEDPDETRNLIDERPEELARMMKLLDAERARIEEARARPSTDPGAFEVSEHVLNEAEKLGYVGRD